MAAAAATAAATRCCCTAARLPRVVLARRSLAQLSAAPLRETERQRILRCLAIGAAGAVAGLGLHLAFPRQKKAAQHAPQQPEAVTEVSNWSGTHTAHAAVFLEPATPAELEAMLADAHARGQKLRAVGAAMSPNGLGLSDDGMISLANLDKVLWIDPARQRIRVQAGIRVDQVVEALRPHGLTLENYASIKAQQIGGYTQTGAHGTGAGLPPVDGQVVAMRLISPALGAMELAESEAEAEGKKMNVPRGYSASPTSLFALARLGLGALGVATELTLRCVPLHRLVETTTVLTREEVRRGHAERLRKHRHLRYMWIPYTDAVVVVTGDPVEEAKKTEEETVPAVTVTPEQVATALRPMRELARALQQRRKRGVVASPTMDDIAQMNFADLRDRILSHGPLDLPTVQECNKAEAEFWRGVQGLSKVDFSDQVLAFECGGQQWVFEMALPAGRRDAPTLADLDYVEALLQQVEKQGLCAPAPIEQRWTAPSTSPMSPAYAGDDGKDALFSWVGIIMYLPTAEPETREAISQAFAEYRQIIVGQLQEKFRAYPHWAKLEVPEDAEAQTALRRRLAQRYPVAEFNQARRLLDPKGVLSNKYIDALFGKIEEARGG